MSKILTDMFSLHGLSKKGGNTYREGTVAYYSNQFAFIENLILCEKIFVDEVGVKHFGLKEFCNSVSGAFDYITDERLYKKSEFSDLNDIEGRGMLYSKVASDNGLYFAPHPIRGEMISNRVEKYINEAAILVMKLADSIIMESTSGNISNINVEIPPVVEHSLHFSKAQGISVTESINIIRNSNNADKFRTYMSWLDEELKSLSPRKRVSAYQPLLNDINKLCKSWAVDMNDEISFRRRCIKLAKIPIIGGVFEFSGLGEIEIKDPILTSSKPHLLFINDLYSQ